MGYNPRALRPEITGYVAEAEAEQAPRLAAADAAFAVNYHLLQVWDLLGLYFCCQEPYADHVEPVPVDYAGGDADGVRLGLSPAGAGRVAFEPYPFDVRPCRVQLAYRRVARTSYPDSEAFRKAWFQAELGLFEFELV
jgi:hypothetical protein